jgi:hypothetical protein
MLVNAIAPMFVLQILDGFINEGTFWGLIGIAVAIAGPAIAYIIAYWRRTNDFDEMIDFLERLTLMQIDEKTAVLQMYPIEVPNWQTHGQQFVNLRTRQIVSDITAIARLREDISDEQRIALNEVLIRLVTTMETNNLDTAPIQAAMRVLNQE